MNNFEWQYLPSGLGTREDYFSWQGAFQKDGRFFLRRSKDDPNVITDLLFGDLSDETVDMLLSEFLILTGGVDTQKAIVFDAIAERGAEKDVVVDKFDRIDRVIRSSLASLNMLVEDAMLDQHRGKWRAIIKVK